MNIKNSKSNYGLISILLHWLMAILIIGLFVMGLYMTSLEYYDSLYHRLPQWHKSLGVITLFLLAIRFTWKFKNINPIAPVTHKKYERVLSGYIKNIFYVLILAICITGYFISTAKGKAIIFFGGGEIPAIINISDESVADFIGNVHWLLAFSLAILVGLHAAAALKHHYIDKDNTLKRMLRR